ncbi:MAG: hypothetical protein MMC33_005119 [Icmadophila ericetorum]|nr:hypothetical protein [Icmadophila ericetorum]
MATTRLRKAFKYPTEDDNNEEDTAIALDEEEQEKLIQKLRAEDEEQNDEWTRRFFSVPMGSMMTYIPALLFFTNRPAQLLSVCCVTSLICTAYILFIPNTKSRPTSYTDRTKWEKPELSPLQKYLPWLNAVLAGVLACYALPVKWKNETHDGFWLLCALPALVLGVIIVAKRMIISVSLDDLEELKYPYKGA